MKIDSVENGAINRKEACLISLGSPFSVENGATNTNTGVLKVYSLLKLALVFPYSAENGASNGSKGVFKFYSQLKLALSLSEVKWKSFK